MSKNHYVDNKEFYRLMVERKKEIKEAESEGREIPKINDEIALIVYNIANYLSTKNNFINYTYREEMVGDAIENCINYLDNFDPEKSKNPFAYFTQICYYAFIRRINKENKYGDLKKKYVSKISLDYNSSFGVQVHDNKEDYTNTSLDFLQDHYVDDR